MCKHKKKHPGRGGARTGARRMPVGPSADVSHRTRPKFTSKDYLRVAFQGDVPDLERKALSEAMAECVTDAPTSPGFRIERFSTRSGRAHGIVS